MWKAYMKMERPPENKERASQAQESRPTVADHILCVSEVMASPSLVLHLPCFWTNQDMNVPFL